MIPSLPRKRDHTTITQIHEVNFGQVLRILRGETASVIAGFRQMATKRKLKGEARREITAVCRYFTNNLHRMRYPMFGFSPSFFGAGVAKRPCFCRFFASRAGKRSDTKSLKFFQNIEK